MLWFVHGWGVERGLGRREPKGTRAEEMMGRKGRARERVPCVGEGLCT